MKTSSFWETPTGAMILEGYEVVVYNEYADADDWVQSALGLFALLLIGRQIYKSCDCGGSYCGGGDDDDGRGERGARRRSRRDGGSRKRPARARRAQAYSDDDDEEMLVDHYGDDHTPRSNMPLRGKRGSSKRLYLEGA